MADFDRFERALATALQADADFGAIPFDPSAVAGAAIERATQGRSVAVRRAITSPQVRWLLAAALLAAALVAILLSAGVRQPSGRLLALRAGHVLSIDVASGHETVLYDGSDAVGVSPDGRWVERGPVTPLGTIEFVAIDGRRVSLPHQIGAPWSWDGHYTSITEFSVEAWTTILDTRDMHRYPVTMPTTEGDWGWDLDPLGRGIVVALGDPPKATESDPEPGAVLWFVPGSAPGRPMISARLLTTGPERAESPRISPDGTLVAYVVFACKDLATSCLTGTHVLDLETKEDRVVGRGRENPFAAPLVPYAWSPDSRWLVVADRSGDVVPSVNLVLLDVAANRERPLGAGGRNYDSPVWSPDSRYITYRHVRDFESGLGVDRGPIELELLVEPVDASASAKHLPIEGGNLNDDPANALVPKGWLP